MKINFYCLIGVVVLFLISCSPPVSVPVEQPVMSNPPQASENQPSDNNQPTVDDQSQISGNAPSIGSADFSIPNVNDNPPSGTLDQLAWGGMGGGILPEQPCGDCLIELAGNSVSMKNFISLQKLKLLFYRRTGTMKDCTDLSTADYVTTFVVQVDVQGNLDIALTGDIDNLSLVMAYDANTGEYLWKDPKVSYINQKCLKRTSSDNSCPGAPPQQVKVGGMAYICTKKDAVKFRDGAGKQYKVLKMLVPGADLEIIGGPVCSDDWSWWQVKTESGFVGWISEGGGDATDPYYLCPK